MFKAHKEHFKTCLSFGSGHWRSFFIFFIFLCVGLNSFSLSEISESVIIFLINNNFKLKKIVLQTSLSFLSCSFWIACSLSVFLIYGQDRWSIRHLIQSANWQFLNTVIVVPLLFNTLRSFLVLFLSLLGLLHLECI